ncbi:hypothetical protein IAQ61_000965 [Plenodomus lingam]|uniref:Predicted protein n=1 Tax=Leptosphaeria maculans (strain JN3 / isolate v23.1.3 / race Av1-4-5-6-7-8) TaxID=985895 RepID=E5A2Q4_LEPMJ|nr:predicted protein [Plenodomus lingam JN3]KAH9880671.1 hypothetical protein IAQ61_000965 [Plenodomus lingam]CBX97850.1 predicted protein [Plenodomus lingam JN3]
MVKCPECGAGADLTKDGAWAHCNTIFEPGKEGSHYKGGGSGSGDKEVTKGDKAESGQESGESNSR